MADYQITCATQDGPDYDRKIDKVGGPALGVHPIGVVIGWTGQGHTFWTLVNENRADVFVRGTILTGFHLTTSPDGDQPNNLLKLPPCP